MRYAVLLLAGLSALPASAKLKLKKDSTDTRTAYIQKVQQTTSSQSERTLGSLWSNNAPLVEVAVDYKARRLNDPVTIQIVEQTSAQTNGNTQQNRTLSINSGVTSVAGQSFGNLNPLLTAASSQALKGNGQVEADSQLSTSLAGQVVCVLPNGNLVVEAQRSYRINGQHDTVVVRGVARPGDISSSNAILSTELMNLEVEMKGKGLVADGTRGPNVVTRMLMRIFGF
jgi:flagellar L-ring protein precursor FlgH